MDDIKSSIAKVIRNSEQFLQKHTISNASAICGPYSLRRGQSDFDLYGMVDAAYILATLGKLPERTEKAWRSKWAQKVLDCQDSSGWFSIRNLRGHSYEHATAYAIGALRLLEIEADEEYVGKIKPLNAIRPILTDRAAFERWLTILDFRLSPRSILKKKLGWHYIWRGSHVAGGIPAAIGMTQHLTDHWWPGQVDIDLWFGWYFEWLDANASAQSGYWQRAFWNLVYHKPTLIDMGGAVHFFWVYEAMKRPFPYPEAIIESTLRLQRKNGLYKDHPFCIDLDGNFCLIRAYLQLPQERQSLFRQRVYQSAEQNFDAIIQALTEKPLEEVYQDSHGLPGALAALVECAKLPGFKHSEALADWQHPLDKVWWL